jgi:glycosyltransferase involved in cell wall biosynthesis
MRRANGWIAFGQTIYDVQHARRPFADRPGRVINPGVDVSVFRPDSDARLAIRDRLGWSDGEFVIGYMGRFIEAKGIQTLIDVLDRSAGAWRLLLVGGGVMQPQLDSLRARHPARVRIVTGVSHDNVPDYLNAMDMLCAPSRTTPRWREQFGRMLIEAMACGVPVVASRSGEIPYVVGDAGLLLPEDDVDAWIATFDRLPNDRTAIADLSARGLERARSRFAWPVVARAHMAFFEELCER